MEMSLFPIPSPAHTTRSLPPQHVLPEHLTHGLLALLTQPNAAATPYLRERAQGVAWEAVCEVLEAISEDAAQLEAACALVTHSTRQWNPTLLRAPERWTERVLSGEPCGMYRVVRHVELRGVALSDERARHLFTHADLGRLHTLRLDGAQITSWAMVMLAECEALCELRELYLAHNAFGDVGVRALASSRHLERLETLSLAGCELGDEGMIALASSPILQRLKELYVHDNRITDRGVRALAYASQLSCVERISLYHNRAVTDEGARVFWERRELGFPRLCEVDVYDCSVSDALCERLSALHMLERRITTPQNHLHLVESLP